MLFGEISVHVLSSFSKCIIFFLLLSIEISLYILSANPLLGMYFASVFYQSIACLFILFIKFFCQAKLSNFDEIQFSVILF